MSMMLKALQAWGCDVDDAMERMVGDEDFYAECLQDLVCDQSFSVLKQALDAGDAQGAFDAAHTLKGVLANLGMTPMYNKIVEIVEPLRQGDADDLARRYAELMQMKDSLDSLLHERLREERSC